MKVLDTKIGIPSALHEFHGKQARVFDLLLTYTLAIFVTLITLYLARHSFSEIYKHVILAILAFDLSGGIVSNLTEGTNGYYHEKPKARTVFMALHLIQPLLMIWLFPENAVGITMLSIYTLTTLVLVNGIKDVRNQRVIAIFFTTIGITFSFLFPEMNTVVHLTLILFLIKLTLAFATNWQFAKKNN